jgi:autotransporter translocation and assembly factor TamB
VDGLLVGTVEVRGPLSALRTTGDMRFAGATGADADVSWRGVFDVRDPSHIAARSLHADVRRLELALLSAFNPGLDLAGSVSGRVEGSGALDRLRFTAALQHQSTAGSSSSFDGEGTVSGAGAARRFDLSLTAAPVSLQDLATEVPALRHLQGDLRGPVHVAGIAGDMVFSAELHTPGGTLGVEGQVQGTGADRRLRVQAETGAFRLSALADGLPETTVAGRLSADVRGNDPAGAHGTVQLVIDSSRVRGMPLGRLHAGMHLGDGLLVVDSASLLTAAGIARARGDIGLIAERAGRLEAGFLAESITPFEEFVFGATAAPNTEPRLAGRVNAMVTLDGWIGALDVDGSAQLEDAVYGGSTARRAAFTLAARSQPAAGPLRFDLVAEADSFTALTHTMRLARIEAAGALDSLSVNADARTAGDQTLHARATVTRATTGSAIRLEDFRIGGASQWLLAAPVGIALHGTAADVDTLVLRRADGGTLIAGGRLARSDIATVTNGGGAAEAALDFRVALEGVPFTEVLAALRSRETGAGVVDAALRIGGTTLNPLIDAELTATGIEYGELRIDHAFGEFGYVDRAIGLHAEAQYGGRSILTAAGSIPLDLRFVRVPDRRLDLPLRVTIDADSLPPALPLGLLDGFTQVGGRIDGALAFGGTSVNPSLSGGFTLSDVTADWDVSGVRYSNVNGTLDLEQGRLLRVDISAQAADPRARTRALAAGTGGSGTVRGTLDFAALSDPQFDLRFSANGAYAARRRDVEAAVTGEIRLGGRYSRPEVSGSLHVDQGVLYIDELYRQYLIVGLELDDPGLLSIVDTSLVAVRPLMAASANPFLRNLQIRNLQVAVANEAWLRSRDMDVEVSGNLNVTLDRTEEDLRMTGALNVDRGSYTLYYPPLQSRRFQVRSGSIEFPGTPGIDPGLAITAAYRARANGEPLDVLAVVTGTLQNPRVRLTSDAQPPYSESDLASYLFFGVPSWEVAGSGGPGAADVRAVAGLGLSALRPSVLGYASSGLQTLVQSAGLLDYVGLTSAEVAPGENALLGGTQLELGRYFWRSSLFVGYSQRLGSLTADPAVRVEWRFQPEFSLELFAEDRFARMPGFGYRVEPGLRKVYGLSVFREWGF